MQTLLVALVLTVVLASLVGYLSRGKPARTVAMRVIATVAGCAVAFFTLLFILYVVMSTGKPPLG